jgi:hypothetical protein
MIESKLAEKNNLYEIHLLSSGKVIGSTRSEISEYMDINILKGVQRPVFRGVPVDRLPAVIRNSVDVWPRSAPFFIADDCEKALEYGDPLSPNRSLLLVFEGGKLKQSFKLLEEGSSISEIDAVKRDYPNFIWKKESNGQMFYSRFLPSHRSAGTPYEMNYGYWCQDPDAICPLRKICIIAESVGLAQEILDAAKLLVS